MCTLLLLLAFLHYSIIFLGRDLGHDLGCSLLFCMSRASRLFALCLLFCYLPRRSRKSSLSTVTTPSPTPRSYCKFNLATFAFSSANPNAFSTALLAFCKLIPSLRMNRRHRRELTRPPIGRPSNL